MASNFVYINGQFLPKEKAFVRVTDRGFLYGDGVFETLRTYSGRLFLLSEHLQRLQKSASSIELVLPWQETELAEIATKLMSLNWDGKDLLLRVTVTRGEGDGLWPQKQKPTLVMQTRDLPGELEEQIKNGIQVIISQVRRNYKLALDPAIKSCNFLNSILAFREAKLQNAFEALMLNYQGYLTEGSFSNLFIVDKSGQIFTPPLSDGLLPGITRGLVINLAKKADFLAAEKHIKVKDLYNSKEVFLTTTSAGIMPVVKVGDFLIGDGKVGKATKALKELYQSYIKEWLQAE